MITAPVAVLLAAFPIPLSASSPTVAPAIGFQLRLVASSAVVPNAIEGLPKLACGVSYMLLGQLQRRWSPWQGRLTKAFPGLVKI